MAVTQQDIDALNAAIASGERVVVLNGQSVTYRSIDDLIKARNDLRKEMADAAATTAGKTRVKRAYAYHSGRGF